MKKYILFLIFFGFFQKHTKIIAQATIPFRGALLEYFQGHTCPNCPRADTVAEYIKSIYGDSVAFINIHSGNFAQPDTVFSFPFTDDLTCYTGESLDTFFGASDNGIPRGLISRTDYDTTTFAHLKVDQDWKNEVDSIINQTPVILVDHSNIYNSTTNFLSTTIYTQALVNLTGNHYLSVFITEDSIISPMTAPSGIDTNHINNNLLRTAINGTWGTLISTGTLLSGSIITNNFNFLMDTAWNVNNCKVVCFVYDNATKEVLQISQKAVLDSSSSPLTIAESLSNVFVTAYPNPFSNSTTIQFSRQLKNASLNLFNSTGTKIKSLNFSGESVKIERENLSTGIYFYQILQDNGNVLKGKLIIAD